MIHAGYVLISASECCPFHQPLVFFHEKLFPLSPPSSSSSLTTSCYWFFFLLFPYDFLTLSRYTPLSTSLFPSFSQCLYLTFPLYTFLSLFIPASFPRSLPYFIFHSPPPHIPFDLFLIPVHLFYFTDSSHSTLSLSLSTLLFLVLWLL